MAINLTKGQKINLEKNGQSLQRIAMGLGWDVAKKKGLLGSIFGGAIENIDLDASCLCFDSQHNLIDNVYFGSLISKDGAIKHSGDNLTGDGDGDDETIFVDLGALNPQIDFLIFTVNSFRGQNFEKVENAFCRVYDWDSKKTEFAYFNLSQKGAHTGMIMLKVYRHNGIWKLAAIGQTTQGRIASQLVEEVKRLL